MCKGNADSNHWKIDVHGEQRPQMATERFRFVGAAGDARLEKRADAAGLIRQAQGTPRVRQNAAAIFVRAIGWIDRIATACQRGAGAQARRETARPSSTGSVGR